MKPNTPKPFTLILIRHGQTDWNAEERYQGQLDIPLNELGQSQANTLPNGLDACIAQHGIAHPSYLYSSDLGRAIHTAMPLQQSLNLPIKQTTQLRERHFGILGGLTRAEMQQQHPKAYQSLINRVADAPLEQGESLQAFYLRIVAYINQLLTAHTQQTVVCITHGGVIDCVYRMVCGVHLNTPRNWGLPNCGINIVQYQTSNPLDAAWQTILWGYTQHLQDTSNAVKAHTETYTAL